MKLNVREKDGVSILDLCGNVDINASDFVETVGCVLKYKSKFIVCNFKEVNLVDYIGVSIIAVIYKNVLNHKGKMSICNVPQHLKNLFSVVGLNRVFIYYGNEDEAIHGLKKEDKIYQVLKQKLRRRFKRIPLATTVEYRQKFSSDDSWYRGKGINLSGIGVFIMARKIFPLEEILSTRIHLGSAPGIIETDVKVVWLADQRIQPQEYPGMGFEFYNIEPEKQEDILRFVERHVTHNAKEEDTSH